MIKVGESTKYDNYGRISCIGEIAELLNLEKGLDHVGFYVDNGEIIVRKHTKSYMGLDFEYNEIRDRIIAYEGAHIDDTVPIDMDPDEIEKLAYAQYLKDKNDRKEQICSKSKKEQ